MDIFFIENSTNFFGNHLLKRIVKIKIKFLNFKSIQKGFIKKEDLKDKVEVNKQGF